MSLNSGETLQPFKALNQLIFDSSGNLIGIQNDRAVGNDLRIGGGSGVDGTFATLIATTALKLNSGATFDLYNTADQTTNYERLRIVWNSSSANVFTQQNNAGVIRSLRLGTANTGSDIAARYIEIFGTSTAAIGVNFVTNIGATTGTQTVVSVGGTINQSGTASYTAFDINPTETATGSGTKLLQRWAVGGSAKAQLSTTGVFGTSGLLAGSSSTIGFSSDFTLAGQDVSLNRDAADTLALRRTTNAQAFRIYNTYTDGSNYERGLVGWVSNEFIVGTQIAGTGTSRRLGLYGSTDIIFAVGGTSRWAINSSYHFVASADNTYDIGASGANRPRALYLAGGITHGSATLLTTTTALTDGAAAATGTLTNAPTAGNPTKWIPINDNGTTRYIPAW